MKERWLTLTAVALGVSQVALILLSWIISAVAPGISMRSLLSSGGIRWFLGHFVDNMLTPLLAWILLLALLWGALNKSGIMALLPFKRHRPTLTYRQRMAIRFVLLELCMFLLAIALLTLLPHAILLSVTGSLFPSSFSQAIVPLLTLIGITCSISYSVISGHASMLAAIRQCLTGTGSVMAWAIPLYVLFIQLYSSFVYVFITEAP